MIRDISQFSPVLSSNQCSVLTSTQFSPALSFHQYSVLTSNQFSSVLSSHQYSVLLRNNVDLTSEHLCWGGCATFFWGAPNGYKEMAGLSTAKTFAPKFEIQTRGLRNNETGGSATVFWGLRNNLDESARMCVVTILMTSSVCLSKPCSWQKKCDPMIATITLGGLCNSFTAGGLLNNQLRSAWICVAIILGASSSCLPKPCPWQRNGRRVTYWTGLTTWGALQHFLEGSATILRGLRNSLASRGLRNNEHIFVGITLATIIKVRSLFSAGQCNPTTIREAPQQPYRGLRNNNLGKFFAKKKTRRCVRLKRTNLRVKKA